MNPSGDFAGGAPVPDSVPDGAIASPPPRAEAEAEAEDHDAPPPISKPWYASVDGERAGPFSYQDIAELVQRHAVNPQSLVWRKGFAEWTPAGLVEELRPYLAGTGLGESARRTGAALAEKGRALGLKTQALAQSAAKEISDSLKPRESAPAPARVERAYADAPRPARTLAPPAPAPDALPRALSTRPEHPLGKIRDPLVTVLLYIGTFGIYGVVWQYSVFEELHNYRKQGWNGTTYLIFLLLFGIPLVAVPWLMPAYVGRMWAEEGYERPVSGHTGFWIFIPLVGGLIWIVKVQRSLNTFWSMHGAVPN